MKKKNIKFIQFFVASFGFVGTIVFSMLAVSNQFCNKTFLIWLYIWFILVLVSIGLNVVYLHKVKKRDFYDSRHIANISILFGLSIFVLCVIIFYLKTITC